LTLPVAAVAQAPTAETRPAAIRVGNHETFGRVVVDLPPGVTASAVAETGGVVVRVVGGTLAGAPHPPRNVASMVVAGAEAHLALAPGARFTVARLLTHLVIDVYADGAAPEPSQRVARAAATPPVAAPVGAQGKHQRTAANPPSAPGLPAASMAVATPPAVARPPAKLPNVVTPGSPPVPVPVPVPVASAPVARPPAPAAQFAADGAAEPVRVPLQRLLDGNLPAILRPPSATATPTPVPASATPAVPADAPAGRPMAAPVTEVETAPLPVPGASQGPLAIAVRAEGATLVLPFAATTGAAAFRRGEEAVVVFDERRPLDLSGLAADPTLAPAFGGAHVQLLPAATVLRMPLPPGAGLRLARADTGWALTRVTQPPDLAPIRGDVADGTMRLAAAAPGAVVSVPDPDTGDALLVGTQTQSGQGVPVTRHTPGFTLLETLQGVAVDPASDSLALRIAPAKQFAGFVLAAEGNAAAFVPSPPAKSDAKADAKGGETADAVPTPPSESGHGVSLDPLGPEAVAALDAAHMTRRWDFPALPTQALLRRLQAATDGAAAAPPQGRTAGRLAAVQAQLALGMGAEAEALANLSVSDDARAADSPDAIGLTAVAAMLAGRLDEADGIADPRLDGSDEVALWRAVHAAMKQEGAPAAASGFASTLPLLLAYPAALRDRLLPLAAETMVQGGEPDAARRLLDARKDDGALDYARAMLAERDGHAAPALALLDRLALSPDRRERARAAVQAAELRLRTGAFTTGQAADALDKLIYSWRGDRQELALRLRVAELRDQSGNWRAALTLLRETEDGSLGQTWADQLPAVHAQMAAVFAHALDGDAKSALSPIELVSLVEENPDLLPEGEAGRALAARLADRLVALDLPQRAIPVLDKLINAAPPGAARAELGARLATIRLRLKDPTGALEALSNSAAEKLPVALDETRTILFARATAARGALAPAAAVLVGLGTAAADDARAGLLEQAKDWPGAVAALSSYAQKTVPPTGPLGEAPANVLLHLASLAAQANDEALLAQLRDRELPRMPPGKLADLMRMLTERPVQGVSDLPRAAQEAALARAMPAALKSVGPPTTTQ
jgi:hypothetical protein